MPICYSGGVKTAKEAEKLVSIGAEKIGICTATLQLKELLSECAKAVGSQSVFGVIDYKGVWVTDWNLGF